MELTGRQFLCALCRCQVVICSRCDRGQHYCLNGCAAQARRQSQRAAGRRYQNGRKGRIRHAERQRRYRARQLQKVTHQGTPAQGTDDSLSEADKTEADSPVNRDRRPICHVCRRIIDVFVRVDFLHRYRRRDRPRVVLRN